MSKTEQPKPLFRVLAGDPEQFIKLLLELRTTYIVKNEWISTTIISVNQQDYNSMVEQVKGDPKLIAAIPKVQTTVMISGLFEVAEKNVKKENVN